MKTFMSYFIALTIFFGLSLANNSQAKEDNIQKYEVKMKTSAFSEMCKNRIETEMKEQKGVLDVYLDLSEQTLTVSYDYQTIKGSNLKDIVENMGYGCSIIEDKASNDTSKPNTSHNLN